MRPLPDRLCVIGPRQAAVYEDAQQALAHARLHSGDGWRIEPGDGMEDDPHGGVEHAVDNHAVEVQMGIVDPKWWMKATAPR